ESNGGMVISQPMTSVKPSVVKAPAPAVTESTQPKVETPKVVEKSESIDGKATLTAPMPGMIIEVKRSVGDTINAGEELVILEAMKMQNSLTSPASGIIKAVKVKSGDSVKQGDILVVIG
ncbi:MAG: acetyl-CoA carboxylase biotin carboxyl carrier protein subunit, partial [Thermodesulfovibrionales bacterium]|nr:acetyl-CoA carboxylase biotin carboxyl carrier protein subunit [Thermodesulfovibrionales bacterium]